MAEYNPEVYWSRVAQEIEKRGENYIAGDDNPYYRYKRLKFLQKFLDTIDFQSKVVLEVGCGPGGNLKHIATHHTPRKLFGVDVSQNMFEIATKNLSLCDTVEVKKIDGVNISYPDQFVDISFTVTVLQHNTDEIMFRSLVQELCRVTKTTIIIMEDIGWSTTLGGEGSWIGRQVDVYKSVFAEYGFQLTQFQFLDTKISRLWYKRISAFYSHFSTKRHQEGDPIGVPLKFLIGLPMPLTRILDKIYVEEQDLAKMIFHRV
ncbi:MAG: class I SAM-dependent methyltransferase [Deltaproteobacteria bacterium]|nr:class I SAM-dependent methyltransferase [Deltaproteobacteria bacterium]